MIWEWYSEGSKSPFVTYSKEEVQGWALSQKTTGELEWTFGLIDTKFEDQQAEWLSDLHQGIPL